MGGKLMNAEFRAGGKLMNAEIGAGAKPIGAEFGAGERPMGAEFGAGERPIGAEIAGGGGGLVGRGGGRRPRVFGYARVSTLAQNTDRQVIALREFGVDDCRVFVEFQSGKDFARPVYRRLLRRLRAGDTLVVKSLDRLGRNYEEILEEWRVITRETRAFIVVLDMPLLDTRRRGADLTGAFVADLVLQILSYVAQMERNSILLRIAEGIAAAKERGVRFGRPPKERPADFEFYADKWRNGEITPAQAVEALKIPRSTFISWAKK